MSEIVSAYLSVEGEGEIRCDAIEVTDGIWLVPSWLEAPDGRHKVPARVIHLPKKMYYREGPRLVLHDVLPKAVWIAGFERKLGPYTVFVPADIRVLIGSQ